MSEPILSLHGFFEQAEWLQHRLFLGEMSLSQWRTFVASYCAQHGIEDQPELDALRSTSRSRSSAAAEARSSLAELHTRASECAASEGRDTITVLDFARVVAAALGHREAMDSEAASARRHDAPSATPEDPDPAGHRIDTPCLDTYGRDLTEAAREGRLRPLVGREDELTLLIETLCRRIKPNPALVGPAGCGKTSLVEGLAQRIVAGAVPPPLRGCRLVEIEPSAVVAGVEIVGEMELRMREIIREASQPGVLLFIDELHSAVGMGRSRGDDTDIASLLKPALARGDLRVIGATTPGEYARYVARDPALERRFHRIDLTPPDSHHTLQILRSLRNHVLDESGIEIPESVLERFIDMAARYRPHRQSADREIDLLEGCVAHARARELTTVSPEIAEQIVQRLVGMPLPSDLSLEALEGDLCGSGLMSDPEAKRLTGRLREWAGGCPAPSRPAAVVLCAGVGTDRAGRIAHCIADRLYRGRILQLDAALYDEYDLEGFWLAVSALRTSPWTVLQVDSLDVAPPALRRILERAVAEGEILDPRGEAISLASTVLVLGADAGVRRRAGFHGASSEGCQHDGADVLGSALRQHCDVIVCS